MLGSSPPLQPSAPLHHSPPPQLPLTSLDLITPDHTVMLAPEKCKRSEVAVVVESAKWQKTINEFFCKEIVKRREFHTGSAMVGAHSRGTT